MTYYVRMTWQGNTGYSQYDGMTQDDILSTLATAGATGVTFITEDDYKSGAVKPAPTR